MANKKIFVIAGEQSGDLHGEQLLSALYRQDPTLSIMGIGGPKMRALGMKCLIPMEEFQVMGFIDVIRHLPRLWRLFHSVQKLILQEKPDIVVTIDYPGFNLRLARALRKKQFSGKLCHYICPSVWAWGKGRIPLMAKNLDLLLSILPFERLYFQKTKLPVIYVGHPLVQQMRHKHSKPVPNLIAIFPGSRCSEIQNNLPLFLQTAQKLKQTHPHVQLEISIANSHVEPLIQKIIEQHNLDIKTTRDADSLMRSAHIALAKSGTVTLELALLGIPSIVAYKISLLDHFLARYIFRIRLPFYCIVNIIAQKQIFPEFIGSRLSPTTLWQTITAWIDHPEQHAHCIQECQQLRHILGSKHAGEEAAQAILSNL